MTGERNVMNVGGSSGKSVTTHTAEKKRPLNHHWIGLRMGNGSKGKKRTRVSANGGHFPFVCGFYLEDHFFREVCG